MKKPKLHVVSFSGGKDSTAMLLRMVEENYPIDIILFCDTGLEFPEMYEHIDKVEKYIGRKITTIKSEKDFMYHACEKKVVRSTSKISTITPGDFAYGYGWSTRLTRWCTRVLKTDVVNQYLRELRNDYEIVSYVGIAIDEKERIKGAKYPLVDWGMTEADCLKYCYNRGFDWGGLYDIWDRVSCWCCPIQSLDALRNLKRYRPELWIKLRDMNDSMSKSAHPNFKWKISLTDIERRFEVEDEFIAQGKKLRTKEFFNELKARGINY